MKKNKIILLTVLIMLVLYCGAVVFVTKPDTFAFSGILGDYNTISGTNKAQLMEEVGDMIDGKIDAAVNDRVVPYVDSSVDAAVDSVVDSVIDSVASQVDEKVNAQVAKAFEALEAKLASEKDALVAQIMAQVEASSMVEKTVASSYVDPADYVDTLLPELVPAVVAELEKNLDAYAPYIVKALVPELLTYEDALAMDMYSNHRDTLIADITPEIVLGIMDRLEGEVFTFVGSVPNVPAMADSVKVVVNVKSSEPEADASNGEAVVLPLLTEEKPVVVDMPAVPETIVDVDAVVAELEKNLSSYAPYVADAVLPELEKDLEKYLPYIVDAVLKAMPEQEPVQEQATETAEVAPAEVVEEVVETEPMTSSEYDAIREETRRTEIENILSQLQD